MKYQYIPYTLTAEGRLYAVSEQARLRWRVKQSPLLWGFYPAGVGRMPWL